MTKRHEYYTLIASLPHLARFDEAERVPINLERLKERAKMLLDDDRALFKSLTSFIVWRRQPVERTDEQMSRDYDALNRLIDDPVVAAMIEMRVNIRMIMAALRRRRKGMPPPKTGEKWGLGGLARHIETNWDDPDFKLAQAYPWIPQVREYLEDGDAVALERLLFSINWDNVDRLKEDAFFGFDVVLAYLFKWDMMLRWLAYDVDAARSRFDELTTEALHEYGRLFG